MRYALDITAATQQPRCSPPRIPYTESAAPTLGATTCTSSNTDGKFPRGSYTRRNTDTAAAAAALLLLLLRRRRQHTSNKQRLRHADALSRHFSTCEVAGVRKITTEYVLYRVITKAQQDFYMLKSCFDLFSSFTWKWL
jgi:hypothetical protein